MCKPTGSAFNAANPSFSLSRLFRRFRGPLLLTVGLLLLENALSVVQPFVFGLAINDLLSQSLRGTLWIVVLSLAKLMVATGRRFYDTRVYSQIYRTVATETIQQQQRQDAPLSAIATRGTLVQELIDFFELHVSAGFTAFVSVVGAVLMLLLYNGSLFGGCLVATALIYLVFQRSEKRTFRLNRDFNNELEQQVNVLKTGSKGAIAQHFQRLTSYRIHLSDLEAINFGISELLLLGLVIFALFTAATGKNPSPGSIFAVLSYVFEFAEGIYALPLIFQQLIRIREISQRLEIPAA